MTDPTPAVTNPARLHALRSTGLLDSPPEAVFDRLTELARLITRAPIALVSLVDAERQFFLSARGLKSPVAERRETPLSHSFCKYAVASGAPFIVNDARGHELVRKNPAIEELDVVAYLGVPLTDSDGQPLGSFCVIDKEPRNWQEEDLAVVTELAHAAITEIELRSRLTESTRRQDAAVQEARVEALQQLSVALRHEINNALTSIVAEVEMLADDPLLPPRGKRVVAVVREQTKRIHDVVSKLAQVEEMESVLYIGRTRMINLSPPKQESERA